MGRLGVPPDRLAAFLEHYRTLKGVCLTGLFTHLASAEDLLATQTEEQGTRFRAALAQLSSAGIDPAWTHVSNSGALLARREFPENMVRIGGLLTGAAFRSLSRRAKTFRTSRSSNLHSPSNPASST
jgi:alanine racemase